MALSAAIGAGLGGRTKDKDDSRIMYLFYVYQHVIIGLNILVSVVIQRALHCRTGSAIRNNTTLIYRQGLRPVRVTDACHVSIAEIGTLKIGGSIFQVRDLPVGEFMGQ